MSNDTLKINERTNDDDTAEARHLARLIWEEVAKTGWQSEELASFQVTQVRIAIPVKLMLTVSNEAELADALWRIYGDTGEYDLPGAEHDAAWPTFTGPDSGAVPPCTIVSEDSDYPDRDSSREWWQGVCQ